MTILVTGDSNAVGKEFIFGVMDTWYLIQQGEGPVQFVLSASSKVVEDIKFWATLRKVECIHILRFDLERIMREFFVDMAIVFTSGAKLATVAQMKEQGIACYMYGRDRGGQFDIETKPVLLRV